MARTVEADENCAVSLPSGQWTAEIPAHHRWMNILTLLPLASLVAVGLVGWLGGYDHRDRAETGNAALQIDGPAIIRNGEYDELVVSVTAGRTLANAALEMDGAYWREITINTMIPAPEKEKYRDGIMRFEFGPLAAGETAEVKIDAQVNPNRFGPSDGDFVLLDGGRELVRLHRTLKVIP